MTAFGLYVHIPFCHALCPYCDFAVVVGRADLHEKYCDALVAEARAAGSSAAGPAQTLFIGGGTPTFVEPALLARALDGIRAALPVRDDAEVTVEANPESLSLASLRELRAMGVTRVSLGAQSFAPHVLRALGRAHTPAQITNAVRAAREAGFDNVSVDLIYGGPGETFDDWRTTLEQTIALGVEHVSCYALTIEERTAFGKAVARGTMPEPEQDALADRYELAVELLARAGFEHYELSNWAKPGSASAHNRLYWMQGEYVGLGLGAHSHVAGVRWWNTRALARYLADPAHARDGEERLDDAARAEEWVTLRLRLVEGLDISEAESRLGRDLMPVAAELAATGLARVEGERLTLTTRGMLLENDVALALLNA